MPEFVRYAGSKYKYNRNNPVGPNRKTELQSALEENSCKDI